MIVPLAMLFVLENTAVLLYVTKRRFAGFPYFDPLEHYLVLRSFRSACSNQYKFPPELWANFKG